MFYAKTKYMLAPMAYFIFVLFSTPCYSLNLPKSTKTQVRNHNKFIRRALITTGRLKKSLAYTDYNQIQAPNGIKKTSSTFDEGEEHSKPDFLESVTTSSIVLTSLPVLIPVIAFNTFEVTSSAFQKLISILSTGSEGVTCNMEEVSIVANGIVVTSIALLFATMASVTVSSLREVSI